MIIGVIGVAEFFLVASSFSPEYALKLVSFSLSLSFRDSRVSSKVIIFRVPRSYF